MKTMNMILILLCLVSTLDGLTLNHLNDTAVPDQLDELTKAEGWFAFKMGFLFMATSNLTKNVLFSPHSIYSNLLTMYVASHGKTEKLIKGLLRYDELIKIPDKTSIENLILWSPPHSKEYELTSVDRIYHTADIKTKKDFETKFKDKIAVYNISDQINEWVSHKTKGLIKEIVKNGEKPGPQTVVFVNAAYFKGYWTVPFHHREEIVPFTLTNGKKVDTLMMTTKGKFKFIYIDSLDMNILALPYKGDDVFMLITLMHKSEKSDGISNRLAEGLGGTSLRKILNLSNKMADETECETEVKIPKFNLTRQYDLKKVLEHVGMAGDGEFFNQSLDLSNAFETGPLKSTEFIHKVTLSVSKTGTEASADTEVITKRLTTNSVAECKFIADVPFFYAIFDIKTQFIYYAGVIWDPNQ